MIVRLCIVYRINGEKSNYLSICHRKMLSSGSNDEINELWYAKTKKSGNNGGEENKIHRNFLWLSIAVMECLQEEKTHTAQGIALAPWHMSCSPYLTNESQRNRLFCDADTHQKQNQPHTNNFESHAIGTYTLTQIISGDFVKQQHQPKQRKNLLLWFRSND